MAHVTVMVGSEPWKADLGEHTTIGRHPDTTVQILDPTLSKLHAEIRRTAVGYLLRDLGSQNGTFASGIRIQQQVLCDGAE